MRCHLIMPSSKTAMMVSEVRSEKTQPAFQPLRKCLRTRNEKPTATATSRMPTNVLAISIRMILA